jgi:hypothetical protein
MADLVETRSASTANVTYRALQQLMKWLLEEEEEVDRSPMERIRPPIVPENPVPVLTEGQLRAPAGQRQEQLIRRSSRLDLTLQPADIACSP